MQSLLTGALNGISYGMLLFMLSAGLTLIFSMLGVLNFAHASFYMLGAYVGYSVAAYAGFWAALWVTPLVVGLAGAALERWLLRRVRPHGPMQELLLTFGVAYLVAEAVKLMWGLSALPASVPAVLDGTLFTVHGAAVSRYRAFMMGVSAGMLGALYAVLRVSKTGLIVHAALTHVQAVQALGHNVPRVFTLVFAIGTALAAAAGVIGAPLFVIEPSMAESIGSVRGRGDWRLGLAGGRARGFANCRLPADLRRWQQCVAGVAGGDLGCVITARVGRADRCAACATGAVRAAWWRCSPCGHAGFGGSAAMRRSGLAKAPRPRQSGATHCMAWSSALPWGALAAFLAAPVLVPGNSWLLAFAAQTAAMMVFALSYNLLLGATGLLSLGHAAYAGLAAFVAAHLFNRFGFALPYLPLVSGIAGAGLGAGFGYVATRRAGTAFAMITLGIGELVTAAAWTLPDWFGGEAGVPVDRAAGPHWGSWSFGSSREAYVLIAVWCLLACVAMFAVSRTPLVRFAKAVRDNPVRVAALGADPRRIRYAMVVLSAFFAGVAGGLSLINIELASAEGVDMARSGAVLIATVIGGSGTFFGPVFGALTLTFFSVALASLTRAWPCYLGLLFVIVVIAAPDGLAGVAARGAARIERFGWRACLRASWLSVLAVVACLVALVLALEMVYARQFALDTGGVFLLGPLALRADSPRAWGLVFALAGIGGMALWVARRAVARLSAREPEASGAARRPSHSKARR
jgi:branched-chain amino acid transport system permease protein